MMRHFSSAQNILEIGCGTGFVLASTREVYPEASLSGSDIFTEGLAYAKQRVPSATLFQMDACRIPYRDEFDMIGSFDVLEHIEDDIGALDQIYQQYAGRIDTHCSATSLAVEQHQRLCPSQAPLHPCRIARQGRACRIQGGIYWFIRVLAVAGDAGFAPVAEESAQAKIRWMPVSR